MNKSKNKPRIEGVAYLADGARIELWMIGDNVGELRGVIFGDLFSRTLKMSVLGTTIRVTEEFAHRIGAPRPLPFSAAKLFVGSAHGYTAKEAIEHERYLRSTMHGTTELWTID